MNNIAIIAVTYNRVVSLQRLLNSLEKAYYGNERPTLVISIDKSESDNVEVFADSYNWPLGEKIVRKHDKNLGLRTHMMSLGEWFAKFDTLIVLEDDLIVSPCYYSFTRQASDKYMGDEKIAGISLYSFATNYQTMFPFIPMKNEYDAYFMNCAMSWGEVWMKPQWESFYHWYLNHQEFPVLPHLPLSICQWGKSWLKYHTRYCIEENKYFIFPYVSLTTNSADPGVHFVGKADNTFQVPLQLGDKRLFAFPDTERDAICYDGFFENIRLTSHLGMQNSECCVDLCGLQKNRMQKKYWLTTAKAKLPILKSFGLKLRPIEQNVLNDVPGNDIFLYDASFKDQSEIRNDNTQLFLYNIFDITYFIRKYGVIRIMSDFLAKIFNNGKKR